MVEREAAHAPQLQVALDLWEGPQPPPARSDVADVNSHLIGPHTLANQTPPTGGEGRGGGEGGS